MENTKEFEDKKFNPDGHKTIEITANIVKGVGGIALASLVAYTGKIVKKEAPQIIKKKASEVTKKAIIKGVKSIPKKLLKDVI